MPASANDDQQDEEESEEEEEEESYEESMEEADELYEGWLQWDEAEAITFTSEEPEAQKRAHFRLGQIYQNKGKLQDSLKHYYQVVEIDPDFYKQ